jgi:hypothetical protein
MAMCVIAVVGATDALADLALVGVCGRGVDEPVAPSRRMPCERSVRAERSFGADSASNAWVSRSMHPASRSQHSPTRRSCERRIGAAIDL